MDQELVHRPNKVDRHVRISSRTYTMFRLLENTHKFNLKLSKSPVCSYTQLWKMHSYKALTQKLKIIAACRRPLRV